jgi:hypothetical protein
MSSDVTANSRTVVHKGDGIVNVSALPDVCKTPSPGGPVPVPYPNVAQSSDLADGAKHVTIDGNPVALENSKLKQSSGDEAGTLGGVVSGKNRGKMTWGTSSPDVCVEGKGVIRFADLTHHNCNTSNVLKMQDGSTLNIINYGDDADCPLCGDPAPPHPILSNEGECIAKMNELFEELEKQKRKEPTDSGRNIGIYLKDGFMVGLLICDCGKVFSAMSGDPEYSSPENFRKVAKGLGHKTEDGQVGLTWDRLLSVKKAKAFDGGYKPDGKAVPGFLKKHMEVFKEKRDALKTTLTDLIRPSESRTKIGQCAAPRVISLAMQSGHNPAYMCERWFSLSKMTTTQESQQRTFRNVADGEKPHMGASKRARIENIKIVYRHEDDVPSCDLCKTQVPALLCGKRPECAPKATR